MATYSDSISRETSPDPLVPEPIVGAIIEDLPKQSAVLGKARTITLPSSINRLPVLDVLPTAYFVSGDTGLKQTTAQAWKNVFLNVEEIAALVPVPLAYIDDAQFPIWDEVRPRLVEAIGAVFDAATLFGVDEPTTWSDDITTAATAAGNVVTEGDEDDVAADIAQLGVVLGEEGFGINGFLSKPGFTWRLNQLRSTDGIPIYQQNLQGAAGAGLYGFALNEVMNGSWDADVASLIAGDWTKAIVGIRRDVSFTMHTDGVISDGSGNVVFNAMQQDSVVLRVVFRAAFATGNPANRLQPTEANRYPFALLGPSGS